MSEILNSLLKRGSTGENDSSHKCCKCRAWARWTHYTVLPVREVRHVCDDGACSAFAKSELHEVVATFCREYLDAYAQAQAPAP